MLIIDGLRPCFHLILLLFKNLLLINSLIGASPLLINLCVANWATPKECFAFKGATPQAWALPMGGLCPLVSEAYPLWASPKQRASPFVGAYGPYKGLRPLDGRSPSGPTAIGLRPIVWATPICGPSAYEWASPIGWATPNSFPSLRFASLKSRLIGLEPGLRPEPSPFSST